MGLFWRQSTNLDTAPLSNDEAIPPGHAIRHSKDQTGRLLNLVIDGGRHRERERRRDAADRTSSAAFCTGGVGGGFCPTIGADMIESTRGPIRDEVGSAIGMWPREQGARAPSRRAKCVRFWCRG